MMPAIALVAAYLIGAIPFGFLLVKWKTGDDIRSSGSGNTGATNVVRTTGWTIPPEMERQPVVAAVDPRAAQSGLVRELTGTHATPPPRQPALSGAHPVTTPVGR